LSSVALALPLWIMTALLIVWRMKYAIGTVQEPHLAEIGMREPLAADLLARSVVNQGWLFFKYVFYWLLPNEGWMSIDMREPFPATWHDWPWSLGALGFVACLVFGCIAAWRGHIPRLIAIGLLAPGLLYLTMFVSVNYQEPFVLYRSYLWALPPTLLLALALAKLPQRGQIIVLSAAGLLLFGSAWSRLQSFSHPILLWDEAVNRLDGRDELPGAARVYFNRGVSYSALEGTNLALAITDFDRVVKLDPVNPYAYSRRGAVLLRLGEYERALDDFEHAIRLNPADALAHSNRGRVLLKWGRSDEGLAELAYGCRNDQRTCKAYYDVVGSPEASALPRAASRRETR
jgi:protein O-mannosyl-transferase